MNAKRMVGMIAVLVLTAFSFPAAGAQKLNGTVAYNFRPPDMARSNRRFPRICRILFAQVAKIILPGFWGYFGTNRVAFASIRV